MSKHPLVPTVQWLSQRGSKALKTFECMDFQNLIFRPINDSTLFPRIMSPSRFRGKAQDLVNAEHNKRDREGELQSSPYLLFKWSLATAPSQPKSPSSSSPLGNCNPANYANYWGRKLKTLIKLHQSQWELNHLITRVHGERTSNTMWYLSGIMFQPSLIIYKREIGGWSTCMWTF